MVPLRFLDASPPIPWGELPLELWYFIMRLIRPYLRKGMLSTSKWFRNLYWETKERYHFSSDFNSLIKPETINRIIQLSENTITNFVVCDIPLGDELLNGFSLTRIRNLRLERVNITKKTLKCLSTLTSLQSLTIYENNLRDQDLSHITSLSSLTEIDIDSIHITDISILYYSWFSLKECNLNYRNGGDHASLIALSDQPLHTLNISSKTPINYLGISQINMSNLRVLRIKNGMHLEPVALKTIVLATNLETLWLHDYHGANFSLLKGLIKLKELSLIGSTVDDAHIIHLKLPILEVLNVSKCPTITDSGVYSYYISPPKTFRYLIIIDCPSLEVYSLYNYLIYDGKRWRRKL